MKTESKIDGRVKRSKKIRADVHQKLILSAIKIIEDDNGKNGVNVSAAQLSKISGVSTVTIYSHFPNLQVDLSLSILNYLLDLALHHYNVNLMNNMREKDKLNLLYKGLSYANTKFPFAGSQVYGLLMVGNIFNDNFKNHDFVSIRNNIIQNIFKQENLKISKAEFMRNLSIYVNGTFHTAISNIDKDKEGEKKFLNSSWSKVYENSSKLNMFDTS